MWWKRPIVNKLNLELSGVITTSYQMVSNILDARQKEIIFTQFKRKSISGEELRNTREIMK